MGVTKKTSRPSVSDALKRLDQAGEVTRLPGTVEHQQSGLHYVWFVPNEMGEAKSKHLRSRFEASGYWLADGEEYLPENGAAEIWCTHQAVADRQFALRKQRNDADKAAFQKRQRLISQAAQSGR